MLPYVPGAMGSNPIPKPVAKNKDGLEKTSCNLMFILFHQLLILLHQSLTFEMFKMLGQHNDRSEICAS